MVWAFVVIISILLVYLWIDDEYKKELKKVSQDNKILAEKRDNQQSLYALLREFVTTSWNKCTPPEDGLYLCKVYYGDIPNDMRILEWISEMDCFCLPGSDHKAYHFFIGEDKGDDVEVVYEWMKLDLPFRMEKDCDWLIPSD